MIDQTRAAAPALTRERILEVSSELIEVEGFGGLSMRKLADQLDCAAMSLYRYFATKEELLSALADRFIAEVELPSTDLPWDEGIVVYFTGVQELFVEHPELAEIAARQHLNAMSAFRGAEFVFGALREAGLEPKEAVSAWYALSFFATGFGQRRANVAGDSEREASRLIRLESLPHDEFEHFHELATVYVGGLSDGQFETGLRILLAGIAAVGGKSK